MTDEQWRPIPGYGGAYEVSSLGRVRSLTRKVVGRDGVARTRHGKLLRPWPTNGYPTVYLTNHVARQVHLLVMLAFVGPPPEGQEVRHRNGDRTDPTLANLAYGTRGENNLDAVQHGTHPQASKTRCPQDHPYDEANTYTNPTNGQRVCRTCARASASAYRDRRRMRAAGLASQPRRSA